MRTSSKTLLATLLLTALSTPVTALEFGRVRSHVDGARLNAEVGLLSAGWADADRLSVRNAPIEQYRRAGVQFPFEQSFAVALVRREGGVLALEMSAALPRQNEGLEVIVEVAEDGQMHYVSFVLAEPVIASPPIPDGAVRRERITVVAGDTLTGIAARIAPQYHTSTKRMARALADANAAFLAGDINRIRIGQQLNLPERVDGAAFNPRVMEGRVEEARRSEEVVQADRLVVGGDAATDDAVAKRKQAAYEEIAAQHVASAVRAPGMTLQTSGSLSVSSVPQPKWQVAAMVLGLLAMVLAYWRRRKLKRSA